MTFAAISSVVRRKVAFRLTVHSQVRSGTDPDSSHFSSWSSFSLPSVRGASSSGCAVSAVVFSCSAADCSVGVSVSPAVGCDAGSAVFSAAGFSVCSGVGSAVGASVRSGAFSATGASVCSAAGSAAGSVSGASTDSVRSSVTCVSSTGSSSSASAMAQHIHKARIKAIIFFMMPLNPFHVRGGMIRIAYCGCFIVACMPHVYKITNTI